MSLACIIVFVLSLATAKAAPPGIQHGAGGGQQQQRKQPPQTNRVPIRPQPPTDNSAQNPTKPKDSPGHHGANAANNEWPTGEDIKRWFVWKDGLGWAEVAALGALAVTAVGVLVSLLTLIVTGLFLRYTYLMWKEMVRQNNNADTDREESKQTTQESLKLTRDAQASTLRSVKLAEDELTAIIGVARARLTVGTFDHLALSQLNQPNIINVKIVNRGHTPAIDAKMTGHSCITNKGEPIEWNALESELAFGGFESVSIIGAGLPVTLAIELYAFSNDQIAALCSGSAELYLRGTVEYCDVFQPIAHAFEFTACYYTTYERWIVGKQIDK